MQKGLKPLNNWKFWTGTENYEENNSIPDDKVFNSRNARFTKKIIGSKPGYETLGDMLTGGIKWQNQFEYPYFDGTTTVKKLIGVYNKTFYEFIDSTQLWSPISTIWPNIKDAYVDGVSMANALYVIGQADVTSTGIQGVNYVFTVSGITTTPTIGETYKTNNGNYSVTATAILTGSGTITMKKLAAPVASDPAASGILTRISTGIGDITINYSAFAKPINLNFNGIGKIFSGYDFTFTVAGVAITPDINSVYVLNGVQFVVIATNLIGFTGAGTITMKRQINFADPPLTGTLSAISGALYSGNSTINYSAFTQSNQISTSFTVIPNTPDGIAIESFGQRLVALGISSTPGLIVMSAPVIQPGQEWKIEEFRYLITGSGALTFYTQKGGAHKACRVIENEIFYWTVDRLFQQAASDVSNGINPTELARTSGAVNQKSTIIVENDVWFFNKQNEVRSLGNERNLGSEPRTKSISEIIKRTMQTLETVQDNPVASYNQRIFKVSLKTKQSPTNNITLIFDYNTGGFSIDYGQAINCACIWNNIRVYGEDATGQAFRDDFGYAANGGAFAFQVDLPFSDDSRPDLYHEARYIHIRGKQSYYQDLIVRLYRDGSYTTYSDYLILSPFSSGTTLLVPGNDGTWGTGMGNAPWGGTSTDAANGEIQMYQFDKLISVSRKSNMFAIGLIATISNSKVEIEQLILKVVDQNENYKRSNT